MTATMNDRATDRRPRHRATGPVPVLGVRAGAGEPSKADTVVLDAAALAAPTMHGKDSAEARKGVPAAGRPLDLAAADLAAARHAASRRAAAQLAARQAASRPAAAQLGAWAQPDAIDAAGPADTVVLDVPDEPPTPRRGRHAAEEDDDRPWPVASALAVVPEPPPGTPAVDLPPPDDEEKLRYRRRRLPVLLGCSLVSFGTLAASQALFVRMSPWLLLFLPAFAFTVLYYLISLAVNVGTPAFDLRRHRRLVEGWQPAQHPSVDVFLPVCGEAPEVLHNTWRHVHRMAGHYPGRVHVYVLDDSASNDRERMALGFGFVYQRRPNRGWYKKAGNMRYAYQRTLSDFILVLDADFTPRHDMLDELLPYFDAEPDLGIVQSPQYFRSRRGQGWLERGAGAVQELFYRSVQVSRQHHEAAICVGSCAVYRRAALDAIGGSTLIEHSEDVHTGFDMRRKGWRLRYVPVPLATGLCPGDAGSFFTQQYRWCAGSMSLLSSTKFWNTTMPIRRRLSYLSGFCYYLHTALFTFAGPLVPIVLLTAYPQAVSLAHYALVAPSVLYTFVVFPLWHRTRYRLECWTVKLLYGWAHAFAIWDLLRGRPMGWQPTGGTAKKSRTRRLWAGLVLWSLGTAVLWTGAAALRMRTLDPATYAPAFLAGAVYLTTVLQALLVDPVRDVPRGWAS
jgi:cellulose synthase (UDP-forming)